MNVMQPIKRSFGPSWPEVPQGLGMAPTSRIFQVSAEAERGKFASVYTLASLAV